MTGITLKNSKFKVDNDYTPVSKVKQVKQDWKDFLVCMTFGDIFREWEEACEAVGIRDPLPYNPTPLYCEASGFTEVTGETVFAIDIVATDSLRMYHLRFYYHIGKGISAQKILMDAETYRVERN